MSLLQFKVSEQAENSRRRGLVVEMLHRGLRSSILFAGGKGSNIADRGEGQLW